MRISEIPLMYRFDKAVTLASQAGKSGILRETEAGQGAWGVRARTFHDMQVNQGMSLGSLKLAATGWGWVGHLAGGSEECGFRRQGAVGGHGDRLSPWTGWNRLFQPRGLRVVGLGPRIGALGGLTVQFLLIGISR
jgi:hypothetical protein